MNILIALNLFSGGGAERVAVVWANTFVAFGHRVIFASDKKRNDKGICYRLDEKVEMVDSFNVKSELYDFMHRVCPIIVKPIRFFYKVKRLRQTIKDYHTDVVLGVMEHSSLLAYMASRGLKVKVISTSHYSFDLSEHKKCCSWLEFKRLKAKKYYLNRLFPVVTGLTQADKNYMGNRLKNLTVLPNPLSLPVLSSPISTRQKKILGAGRIDDWHYKGFDLLIKAWAQIEKLYPEWILEIAGNYTSKKDLDKLIADAGIENRVIFSGFHTDMEKLYQSAEIFVLSSRYEGFGMVLIEAMSQGCACITCDYKGRQKEIITDDSFGLVVKPNDEQAIATALEKMIDDETYRKMVQKNAPERAKDFSPENIYVQWLKIFKGLGLKTEE